MCLLRPEYSAEAYVPLEEQDTNIVPCSKAMRKALVRRMPASLRCTAGGPLCRPGLTMGEADPGPGLLIPTATRVHMVVLNTRSQEATIAWTTGRARGTTLGL